MKEQKLCGYCVLDYRPWFKKTLEYKVCFQCDGLFTTETNHSNSVLNDTTQNRKFKTCKSDWTFESSALTTTCICKLNAHLRMSTLSAIESILEITKYIKLQVTILRSLKCFFLLSFPSSNTKNHLEKKKL